MPYVNDYRKDDRYEKVELTDELENKITLVEGMSKDSRELYDLFKKGRYLIVARRPENTNGILGAVKIYNPVFEQVFKNFFEEE